MTRPFLYASRETVVHGYSGVKKCAEKYIPTDHATQVGGVGQGRSTILNVRDKFSLRTIKYAGDRPPIRSISIKPGLRVFFR
jgi:hypothetical protein